MEKLRVRGTVPDLSRVARIYKIDPAGVAAVRRIVDEVLTRPAVPGDRPEGGSRTIEWQTDTKAGE